MTKPIEAPPEKKEIPKNPIDTPPIGEPLAVASEIPLLAIHSEEEFHEKILLGI